MIPLFSAPLLSTISQACCPPLQAPLPLTAAPSCAQPKVSATALFKRLLAPPVANFNWTPGAPSGPDVCYPCCAHKAMRSMSICGPYRLYAPIYASHLCFPYTFFINACPRVLPQLPLFMQESHHSTKSAMQPSQSVSQRDIRADWWSIRVAIEMPQAAKSFTDASIARLCCLGPGLAKARDAGVNQIRFKVLRS